MAKLYYRYGAMNSGKTTALLQVAFNYNERGMRVLILKASVDTKGGDHIVSRLGVSHKGDVLVSPDTVDLNIPVICYGLRADFMNRGFPGSTRLLELAHTIEEMKTICACGRKATCNGRKVNGEFVFEGAQVAIDTVDAVEYQSLCPQCWYREYRAFLKRHPAHQ